ncbi:sugar kinase [bacterium]|nr:sugar kinase [candidate division CSSED10-310 bacterium]
MYKENSLSSVLIVGSVALDSVKTPYGHHKDMLGGSATYFSMAASHFVPVRLVAVVGTDFPETARNLLISKHVDLSGLQVVEGRTFRWAGEYRGSMNEAITHETQLNVFQNFEPCLPDIYADTKYVFLGNIDPALQLRVLSQISKPELVALDTMNFWIESARDTLLDVLKKIDLLIINEGELRLLTGENRLPDGVRRLCDMGPRSLVIKRGEYGSILYHDQEWFFVPGYPEPMVVDPTGAGDSFAGGFMGSIARDAVVSRESLRRAMVSGSVMASYNITDFGPWKLAGLTGTQIDERFNQFVQLVTI